MSDPVTRAARRQNLLDRLAEHLTGWGCPPDIAATRAAAILHTCEHHGWALPTIYAPPLTGRGSTAAGRERARLILEHTRRGCRCGTADAVAPARPPAEHPQGCPVRDAEDVARGTAQPLL